MFFKLRDFFGAEVVHGLYAVVHRSTLLAVNQKQLPLAAFRVSGPFQIQKSKGSRTGNSSQREPQ
jgi:hypothetical protein